MPMDEVIRAIEQTDAENIQDVMQAAIKRYKELYPEWQMLFLSAKSDAVNAYNQEILDLIHKAEELVSIQYK